MTLLLSTPFRLTHDVRPLGAAEVGAAIAPWPLTNMVVAPMAGWWLSDRVPAGIPGRHRHGDLDRRADPAGAAAGASRPMSTSLGGHGAVRIGVRHLPAAQRPADHQLRPARRERPRRRGGLVSTVRLLGQTTGATAGGAAAAGDRRRRRIGCLPLVAAGLAVVAGLCSLARLRPSIRNPNRDRERGRRRCQR